MLPGHVVDQLRDQHGLAEASAAEQSDLAAAGEGADQIHHLQAGLEHLGGGHLFLKRGRRAVDRPEFRGVHRPAFIDRLAEQVEHPPEGRFADRDRDRPAGVDHLHPAHQAVRAVQCHAPDDVVPQHLRHLDREVDRVALDPEGVEDGGEAVRREPDVHHRADDLHHFAGSHSFDDSAHPCHAPLAGAHPGRGVRAPARGPEGRFTSGLRRRSRSPQLLW